MSISVDGKRLRKMVTKQGLQEDSEDVVCLIRLSPDLQLSDLSAFRLSSYITGITSTAGAGTRPMPNPGVPLSSSATCN